MKKLLKWFLVTVALKWLLVIVALVVLLPVLIVFFRPSLIITKQDARKQLSIPASKYVEWRGAQQHYTDEGTGIPVVMIHGFGGSFENFNQLAALMKNDYRVIRFDLPGFGLSDFPEGKAAEDLIQTYRDYITFMLDTLNLDSVYVIGNSMGGGITWMMAGDHPDVVRKIVLLNAAGYDVQQAAAKLTMFKYNGVGKLFERGMPMFMTWRGMERSYADPTKIDAAVVEVNNKFTNRQGNITHMLRMGRAAQFPDPALITRVQCPTLIVWGQQDSIIPVENAQRYKRDIKNSEVVIFDTCGHIPMMEVPEKTRDAVAAFFKK